MPRLQVVWADSSRPEGARGFVLLPKRWVVERTFAWLSRARRLSKDYERRTDTSAAMLQISMIHLMLRRLQPTPTVHPYCYAEPARKAA